MSQQIEEVLASIPDDPNWTPRRDPPCGRRELKVAPLHPQRGYSMSPPFHPQ